MENPSWRQFFKFIPAVMQLSGQYCLPQAGNKPATLAAKVRIKASFPVGLAAMTHAPPNWTLQRSAESVQSSGNERSVGELSHRFYRQRGLINRLSAKLQISANVLEAELGSVLDDICSAETLIARHIIAATSNCFLRSTPYHLRSQTWTLLF